MPAITKIETMYVRLPTRRKHRWTGLTEDIGGFVLVRAVGFDGSVGWGEAPVLIDWHGDWGKYYGEAPDMTRLLIEKRLGPAVMGREALDGNALLQAMDAVAPGYPYAKAAVEMACLDLAGRSIGVPVYQLLGGKLRDRIMVTHSIGLLPVDEAVAECRTVASEGVRTIKIKVGEDPERDIEVVSRIREAVGPKVALCVDANRGWKTVANAVATLRAMEPFGIIYAEQPVQGAERIARVAEMIATPVMADESAWNSRDALEIAMRGSVEIISIYTTKPGGLRRAHEVAAVAHAAGIQCNVNGSVETGIGNLANVQLAASAPAITLSCVIPISKPAEFQDGRIGGNYYTDDLIRQPFEFSEGAITVPGGPGMGIEIDESKVHKYTIA